MSPAPPYPSQRGLDLLAAVLLGVLAAPAVAVAAVLVRVTSRGPVLYTQTRLGVNGRPFRILKLRTMYHNCEAVSGVRWAAGRTDPRITPVGRVLRRLHVDELPQLWNVLAGHMSLVGPRPERPEIIDRLVPLVPRYADRLAVRPGVTGLAQIQLPADESVDSVREKLRYDRVYVAGRGLWLDVRVAAGTAGYLVGLPYPWVRRLFALPAPPPAAPAVPASPPAAAVERQPVLQGGPA